MPQHIKAIETNYAGCRFRSRLEARWAIFFDTLGIRWEYEPEGFETSAGRYLPDFRIWIPQMKDYRCPEGQWFEVKPDSASRDERHEALARGTGTPVIVARGMPRDYNAQMLGWRSPLHVHGVYGRSWPCAFTDGSGGGSPGNYCTLGENRHWCQEDVRETLGGAPHLALWTIPNEPTRSCGGDYPPIFAPGIDTAYTAARSARFEHGETGR